MIDHQKKYSVTIVQRLLPHYRISFFRLLTRINPDLEITVFHGDTTFRADSLPSFSSRFFRNYIFDLFGYTMTIQPTLMMKVLLARPDVLIIEGTFGVLTNFLLLVTRRIMRLPTLYWTAGWDNPKIAGWRLRLKSLFIRISLRLCSGAIAYGSEALRYLTRHGLVRSDIVVAQNTIDIEALISKHDDWASQGALIRKKHEIEKDFVITYVGQLTAIKRVRVLLEAYDQLAASRSDIALLIVGAGDAEEELKQWAMSRRVPNVHFAGEVVNGVEAYFAAGDLFVLPGTGGLAINHAMALGLPIIATIADGTQRDLVLPGQNGYLVPVDDVSAMAEAINAAISSPQQCKNLGKNSLKIIKEKASLQNMAQQYSLAIRRELPRTTL